MTKRKNSYGDYSQRELSLYHMRKIADDLLHERPLDAGQRLFIIEAFREINAGIDASEAFRVKPKRGERGSSKEVDKRDKLHLVIIWVAMAIKPLEGEDPGLGMSLMDALAEAAEQWGYSEEYLLKAWKENPELHQGLMPRPISTLPHKDPK